MSSSEVDDDSEIIISSRPSASENKQRTRNTRGAGNTRTRTRIQKKEEPKEEPPKPVAPPPPKEEEKKKQIEESESDKIQEFSEASESNQIQGQVQLSSAVIADTSSGQQMQAVQEKISQLAEVDFNSPNFSTELITGTFFIDREKRKSHLKSQRYYKIKIKEDVIMVAKDHGMMIPDVYINEGQEVHVKSQVFKYKMTTNFKKSEFKAYSSSAEIGTVYFDNTYSDVEGPRQITARFGDYEYHSKPPKYKDGKWILRFDGHFTLASMRNAILLDQNEEKAITMRKISSNTFEINVHRPTPIFMVVCIGISNYIYPK